MLEDDIFHQEEGEEDAQEAQEGLDAAGLLLNAGVSVPAEVVLPIVF